MYSSLLNREFQLYYIAVLFLRTLRSNTEQREIGNIRLHQQGSFLVAYFRTNRDQLQLSGESEQPGHVIFHSL